MSGAEAREAVKLTNTGEKSLQFFEAAMKSGRVEIIEVWWETAYTHGWLSEAVITMPDSPLKDRLVSRYLRNPRIAWPTESPVAMRMEMYRTGTIRFMIPLVRRYLPDTPMNFSVIATREKRLKLADAFDTAAGIPIEREPDAKRVWPPLKLGDSPIIANTPSHHDDKATQPNAAAPTATVAKASESWPLPGGWAPWTCIAVAIAGIAVWLARRFRVRKA